MTQIDENAPTFNLWTEPWIVLEHPHGELSQHSISDVLAWAHEYTAIYDPSPLVVVGIHRLLIAILQDALDLRENSDLDRLWLNGKFPKDKIEEFGRQYTDRFDLFSRDKPFFQSADLPIFPDEKDRKISKPIAQLFPETPSGSLVTHYRHTTDEEQVFSPAVVALGLVTIPPFITSGGAGLMPSINGVPPIYVLPSGRTLFESLAASLLTEHWLDKYVSVQNDLAWWKRTIPVVVQESKKMKPSMTFSEHHQLSEVGYLHGLTFPARKVRVYPERMNAICSRTGQLSEWCVRRMTFRMGESCLDKSGWQWQDPFVAYQLPLKPSRKRKSTVSKKKSDKPQPIRPKRNKTPWREFTGLFLQHEDINQQTRRPLFLNQFAELEVAKNIQTYPFRCIAWQTDGKMKYYEWTDFGFDIPPILLQDPYGAMWTEQALSFANECADIVKRVFSNTFRRDVKSPEHFKHLKDRLEADYWSVLSERFRQYVLDLGDQTKQKETFEKWLDTVVREAKYAFNKTADITGNDGNILLKIERGKEECRKKLNDLRNKTKQGG